MRGWMSIVCISALSVTCVAAVTRKGMPSPSELLREAYQTAHDFSPEQRADFLLAACKAASDPSLKEPWSVELFNLSTRNLPLGNYRAAMQKNALTQLSTLDPERAADLYTQQDTPDMWGKEQKTEDFRAYGTRTLFPRLLQSKGDAALPKIRYIADWIGSTGEYPFAAVGGVVRTVKDRQKADELFADGVRFAREDRGYVDFPDELTDFILSASHSVSQPLLRQAIEVALDRLSKPADETTPKFQFEISSGRSTVRLNNESEYYAYRLLPVIATLDPEWASKIREKYALLKYLPAYIGDENTQRFAAAAMPGQDASSSAMEEALDEHRLLEATIAAESDPKQAAEIARSIQAPSRRAIALATIAPGYSSIDEQQAHRWTKEAEQTLASMPADVDKLRLLVALVGAEMNDQQIGRAEALAREAYDLGQELFEEDMRKNPGKMTYAGTGEAELEMLAKRTASNPALAPETLLSVRSLRDPLLRARVLTAVAAGLNSGERSVQAAKNH